MSVTLDGVVQAPARPDEDTRGGFTHGGWGQGYHDDVAMQEASTAMSRPGAMLLGRRTWQDFATVWGARHRRQPVQHSHECCTEIRRVADSRRCHGVVELGLLRGEATETVADLKRQSDEDLGIIGSASLVRTLHAAGLIDHYTLLITPLTLGAGARLFEHPAPLTEFELTRSVVTTTGVIIAHYDRR